jgi:peptide-methionine (S)-S-oxide reductase
MSFGAKKLELPTAADALPGRKERMPVPEQHFVSGRPMQGPFAAGLETAMFALGCFWGAEKAFWQRKGVWVTAVGYAAGFTENPTYKEVCTGRTGHAEVVRVVYDPKEVSYDELLALFFESHDPTQGMRQGADVGTQYRSGIYTYGDDQKRRAEAALAAYQTKLTEAGYGTITTEIRSAPELYFAEEYHQQYLAKNPDGYCGHGGTGVACPVGLRT